MDLLTIGAYLSCSLYPDEHLVRAIVAVHSQGHAYFVTDTRTTVSYENSLQAAQQAMEKVKQSGGRPIVGLMSVPMDWAVEFGRSERELFNPCTNVGVGTAMLDRFHGECAREPGLTRRQLRACVATKYANALDFADLGSAVLKSLRHQERKGAEPAAESSIFPGGVNEVEKCEPGWCDLPGPLEVDLGGEEGLAMHEEPKEAPSLPLAPADRPSKEKPEVPAMETPSTSAPPPEAPEAHLRMLPTAVTVNAPDMLSGHQGK